MTSVDVAAMVAAANLTDAADRVELADALADAGRDTEADELRRDDPRPLVRLNAGRIYRLAGVGWSANRWRSRDGALYHRAYVAITVMDSGEKTAIHLTSEVIPSGGDQWIKTARTMLYECDVAFTPLAWTARPFLRLSQWCEANGLTWWDDGPEDVRRKRDL